MRRLAQSTGSYLAPALTEKQFPPCSQEEAELAGGENTSIPQAEQEKSPLQLLKDKWSQARASWRWGGPPASGDDHLSSTPSSIPR